MSMSRNTRSRFKSGGKTCEVFKTLKGIKLFANGIETIEIAGQSVPRHYGDPQSEYLAARHGAVVIQRSQEGRLQAVGRDRLDLLHRMSTNDLNGLAVGEARRTVLTTAIARMVDALWVLNRGETVLCITGVGRAMAVRKWLAGYIFYNDQVKFEDVSNGLGQLGIYGPRAGAVMEALTTGTDGLVENRFVERDNLIVWHSRPLAGAGYTLIAPIERLDSLWDQALAAGATPAGEEAFQMLRLAAGWPEAGHEITEEFIPLEANLWDAVSFSKGCYIGQEIIARMESRGRLARRLVGLKLEASVEGGSEVRAGEGIVGKVTSAGIIPEVGPVALSFLKTAFAEPNTHVQVGNVGGIVTPLPFV
jgi:folate-binding protein YgfZ